MEFLKCNCFNTEFLAPSKNAIKVFDALEIHLIPGSKDYVLGLADINNKYIPVFNLEGFLADIFQSEDFEKMSETVFISEQKYKFLHIQNYCEELIFQVSVSSEKIILETTEQQPTEVDNNKQSESIADLNSMDKSQPETFADLPFFTKHQNHLILDVPQFFNFLDCI